MNIPLNAACHACVFASKWFTENQSNGIRLRVTSPCAPWQSLPTGATIVSKCKPPHAEMSVNG